MNACRVEQSIFDMRRYKIHSCGVFFNFCPFHLMDSRISLFARPSLSSSSLLFYYFPSKLFSLFSSEFFSFFFSLFHFVRNFSDLLLVSRQRSTQKVNRLFRSFLQRKRQRKDRTFYAFVMIVNAALRKCRGIVHFLFLHQI